METGEIEPPGARPLAGLPDPDVWSARWARGLATAGLAAWLLPLPELSEDMDRVELVFPWSPEPRSLTASALMFVPPLAALAAFLVVRSLRGARRGLALVLLALAAIAALGWGAGEALAFTGGPPTSDLLLLLGGNLGGLAAAVGNHLRKRAPSSDLARLLCVVGGSLILLMFLVPVAGKPFIANYFDAQAHRGAWPLLIASVLVLAYGCLGIRQVGSGPGLAWLGPWMSRLSRALLVIPPLGIIGLSALLAAHGPSSTHAHLLSVALSTSKAWCGVVGFTGGLAVGVAALLEQRILVRMPKALDPHAAADVFG